MILPLRVTSMLHMVCAGAISILIQLNNSQTGSLPRLKLVFATLMP